MSLLIGHAATTREHDNGGPYVLKSVNKNVVIVGAGIGGLTAALSLARSGGRPIVCERAPELDDIGGGITIRTNASRVLNSLGIFDRIQDLTARISSASLYNREGRLLRRWQLPTSGADTITIRRTDLQRVLVEQLLRYPHRLQLGFSFDRFEQTPEQVTAYFANGESIAADALIGCDGLNSQVRKQIVGREPPSYRGYVQWRFISDCRHPVVGPHEKMEWWGNGLRFGASPLGRGMAWYVSVNSPRPDWRGGDRVKDYLLGLFADWANPIGEMISEVVPEKLVWTSIYDRHWVYRWGEGRVTLLGDAAHPFTPDLGLGGALAIEDAEELHRRLHDDDNVMAALRTYEDMRCEKARVVGVKSRFTGHMAQWANPVMTTARNTLVARCPDFIWSRKIKQTYL
jgi:2-polyprenyl-6-methoxyphenol hydroxylase-like FAD-dependent oxidoreductase